MIEIKGLNKTFGDNVIFKDFSLNINDGEFVIISGKSGRGKTTLLNIMGFLEPFDSGEILIDGKKLSGAKMQREYWQNKVGFLFQNFALIKNMTVRQNLEIIKEKSRSGLSVEDVLQKVGIPDKIDQKIFTLSGGEQQRVAIARLFMKKCDVVLADEPTGSLDKGNAESVIGLLTEFNSLGKTVVIVTHDDSVKAKGKKVIEI